MFCPKCGAKNRDDAEFCSTCGCRISEFIPKQEPVNNGPVNNRPVYGAPIPNAPMNNGPGPQKPKNNNIIPIVITIGAVAAAAILACVFIFFKPQETASVEKKSSDVVESIFNKIPELESNDASKEVQESSSKPSVITPKASSESTETAVSKDKPTPSAAAPTPVAATPTPAAVTPAPSSETGCHGTYSVTTNDLSLRAAPGTQETRLCYMNLGDKVDILEYNCNGFYKVRFNGQEGYALPSYLSPDPGASTQKKIKTIKLDYEYHLRDIPSTDGDYFTLIPAGAEVDYYDTCTNMGRSFLLVSYNNQFGYILNEDINF